MLITFFWLFLSVAFFGVGEYLSKKFALQPSFLLVCCILPMYSLGSLAWLPAIYRGQTLATVGTIWNLLSLLATLVVGLLIFHETLTTTQMVGVFLAFVSIILLSI